MVEYSAESNTEFSALMILIGQNEFIKAKVSWVKCVKYLSSRERTIFLETRAQDLLKFLNASCSMK